MNPFPELKTDRLRLRRFHIKDADRVKDLASDRELAVSTLLPHPYKDGMAERWIMSQFEDYKNGRMVNFAIELIRENILIGSIGLELTAAHRHGQLGYWVGVPYWNEGYCTEAGRAVVAYGFEELKLNRIWAPHFKSNPASGRVLEKVGMQYEGCQRQQYLRFGQYEDVNLYGMLRSAHRQS